MKYLPPSLSSVVFLLLFATAGWAADFQAGADAYKRGDYAAALEEWRPLADSDSGGADAQLGMALMHLNGQGVPQSDTAATRYFSLASDQGDAYAQLFLSWLYVTGRLETQPDTAMAVEWLVRAVERGRDDGASVRWWLDFAADQGYVFAQSALGVLYATGRGGERDDETAIKWFTRASEQGLGFAQVGLGDIYAKREDVIKAYMWFDIAAAQGDAQGAEKKSALAETMKPLQLKEADNSVRACIAQQYRGC